MYNPSLNSQSNILIKKSSSTDYSYGINPNKRSINELLNYGIINVNKQAGPTSHQIVDNVKKILHINKAGHSGTLDPKVTGVLVVSLGRATRIAELLLKSGKEYIGIMHVHKELPIEQIYDAVEKFKGKIKQIPPVRSAVKRVERTRSIYYFDIIEIKGKDVLFRVGCEAGTYIRKLVSDIGKELNVGAHMAQLIRTKIGSFTHENWHNLHDIKDAYEFWREGKESYLKEILLPIENAVLHLPKIWVFDNVVSTLCHGSNLYPAGVSKLSENIKKGMIIAVMTLKEELVGIMIAQMDSNQIFKSDQGLVAKPNKIFMEINSYSNNKDK